MLRRGSPAAALAAPALLALFTFHPPSASACSICQAGDPIFASGAATGQETGSVSAYLELQGWRKTSGLLIEEAGEEPEPGREVNESQSLTLSLSATPMDRLTITLQAPWRFNTITEAPTGEDDATNHLNGFGDVSLTVGYVVWRDRPVLPGNWVEARLFGKAPTGPDDLSTKGVTDPHLQPGTGSWDWGTGLAGGHRFEWGTFYASAAWRFNQPGALEYEYGDVGLVNLALLAPLGHLLQMPVLDFASGAFEFNYRYAERDRYLGQTYADSGGSIFYVTPSLLLRLPFLSGGPSIRLAVQCPLGDRYLYGQQHEGFVWSTGLLYQF